MPIQGPDIYRLFDLVVDRNASDLHLTVGRRPVVRLQGRHCRQALPSDRNRVGDGYATLDGCDTRDSMTGRRSADEAPVAPGPARTALESLAGATLRLRAEAVDVDPETLEALRAVGYLPDAETPPASGD